MGTSDAGDELNEVRDLLDHWKDRTRPGDSSVTSSDVVDALRTYVRAEIEASRRVPLPSNRRRPDNTFKVSRIAPEHGSGVLLGDLHGFTLSADDATELAAWIVLVAGSRDRFLSLLDVLEGRAL